MKTKFFVKTAVVAMAAFGAFAFNPNEKTNQSFFIHDSGMCRNVNATCSQSGSIPCFYTLDDDPLQVWSDAKCLKSAYYPN